MLVDNGGDYCACFLCLRLFLNRIVIGCVAVPGLGLSKLAEFGWEGLRTQIK